MMENEETLNDKRCSYHGFKLTRSNLRDLILFLSFLSSFVYIIDSISVIISLFLLLIGIFIHFVSKGTLIRNTVLCNKGIYGMVRHPYYLANYLIDLSFCLLSGNPYLLLLYPFLFFWAYGTTLQKEEKILEDTHGSSFKIYALSVPQIFPDKRIKHIIFTRRNIFANFSFQFITRKEIARILRFVSMFLIIILIHSVSFFALKKFDLSYFLHNRGLLVLLFSAFLCYVTNIMILKSPASLWTRFSQMGAQHFGNNQGRIQQKSLPPFKALKKERLM